ncbi:MAG: nucleotidyltransferase domain-containing protein [Candidatus Heimdallarchaeota archaeon]
MQNKDNASLNLKDLVVALKSKLTPIFEKYNCQFVYLAGSWATGQVTRWSDIDVFVSIPRIHTIDDQTTFDMLVSLNTEAEQVTGISTLEVWILETLPIHVQFQVIAEGIVLYEKSEKTRLDYKERIMKLYYDHIIWYENMLNLSLKQTKLNYRVY